VFVRTPGEPPHEELSYDMEVRCSDGQLAPATSLLRDMKERHLGITGGYIGFPRGSGKSFEDELIVTSLYILTEPGDYTIRGTRGTRPMWQTGVDGRRKVKHNHLKGS
jgi:hypothetical protein